MLCVCLRVSCWHALSQTHRKAGVRRGSIVFDSSGWTHLPGTSRHSRLRICSRRLLLIRVSWYQKFVRPLSAESMGGDWGITGAAVPAAVNGHPPDVHPILFSDTWCVLGSSTLGMEGRSLGQRFDLVHRADTRQRHVGDCIQGFAVHPTRAVRSFRVAAALGGRTIHRSAFSGKQGLAAPVSTATLVVVDLGDCLSSLALEFHRVRPRSGCSNMAAG